MNFVEELRWRGMIKDIMPGTETMLAGGKVAGYVGYDPTAPSLHLGHLVPIMMQVHFQRHGHRPIALVGGATGMIGDPSGRCEERNLLPPDVLRHNQEEIKKQLERFLDFSGANPAEMVNNHDWFRGVEFLDFLRDVGKHLTINYMLAKDSVQMRLEKGLSFTEFSYQLLQAYDFYWLYQNRDCRLQMGGSDQWGNITAGAELIRRKAGGEAFALTCPLITRSDGSKFGKSEGENIWLAADRTSPYKFYQYWLNGSDTDAEAYARIFTLFPPSEIEEMVRAHAEAPHRRLLQKAVAEDVTVRVHSREAFAFAVEASEILFGRGTTDTLRRLTEEELLAVLEGVPRETVPRSVFEKQTPLLELLAVATGVFPSKGEARRMIQGGGVSLNKERIVSAEVPIGTDRLLNGRFLLVQKGKKNYHLIIAD